MDGLTVQERPATYADQIGGFLGNAATMLSPGASLGVNAGDAISRFAAGHPQAAQSFMQGMNQGQFSSPFGFIPGGNVLQGLFAMLQQLLGNGFGDNEQYFQNANGGSVGDPHLSFNGSTWDNMGSQPDLLHSDSFNGGFQISTQTTPPSVNGVTYNQSATVTTNNGSTSVSMDKAGNVSISQYGNSFALQPGQAVDLENGEFVQRAADGSLTVTCNNGAGGEITTTMKSNGTGVDVTTSANNVDLGGALINGSGQGQRTLMPMHRWDLPTTY